MRAAIFNGVGNPVTIEEVRDPEPTSGQIVLKVERCGICGTDLHVTGHHNSRLPVGSRFGHEFAGEVVALGRAVERLRLGDRITAMPLTGCGSCAACLAGTPKFCDGKAAQAGGFGQFLVANERDAVILPKSLTFEDGALIEPLAVALHGVNLAKLERNARVLVIGAGPIGLAAAFFSRLEGARVAVAATSRVREDLAYKMGAAHFLDPAIDTATACWDYFGAPPDVVFECVGIPGMLEKSIDCACPGGKVVVLGFCAETDSFVPSKAVAKELKLLFSMIYSLGEFEQVARTLDAGKIEPRELVTQTIGLAEFPGALEALRNRGAQCKVMVAPWQ